MSDCLSLTIMTQIAAGRGCCHFKNKCTDPVTWYTSFSTLYSHLRLFFKSNQIKSNHFYCHITTAQVPWWVKFLWACSRQCRKTTDNLPMDRQCKKTTNNLHMDRQCKKNNKQFTCGQAVQKNNKQFTYGQTVQKKQQQQFTYGQYIFTDCTEDNVQNTHTYTQYA